MREKHTSCPVCSKKKFSPLSKEYTHASLVKCSACSFVFCIDIPTQSELEKHYATYPRNNKIAPLTLRRYNELLDEFEQYRQHNRILDIGCGDGYFLATAKVRGWQVVGTEYTDDAIQVCIQKGIQMYKGAIESIRFHDTEFDVITSFEVIEHLNNGNVHVRGINKLLRKNGLFYFTTPNFNSISRRILGGNWSVIEYPEHLSYYTSQTIDFLMKSCLFKKQRLLTTGISIQRLSQKDSSQHNSTNQDEILRKRIEQHFYMRVMKKLINFILSSSNLGDTIKGYYRKA
jgi:2-polyprenyl-3-methyl-5-hydroxy-6-metoxy-1,4-benzoquinol methylase